jgi:diguanylate cyclase (GGDEF)-like protein
MHNTLLLVAQALLYFAVMAALFRLRHRFGIGLFVCAIGVMHFLETFLASVFYIQLPFGMISPGSTVMFSGKLVMLLLLYMREDAAAVRQPIYGLLIGNFLMVALVVILRQHVTVSPVPDRIADVSFVDELGWLMVWGTSLLFIDSLGIILLYERLGRFLRQRLFLRILAASCAILTFDQLGFWTGLHLLTGAPAEVLIGGWIAKMGAAVIYSAAVTAYLRLFENGTERRPRALVDVFEALTYRERYHALVEHAGRDSLTGLLHRGRMDASGQQAVDLAVRTGRPVSLLMIDIDHFKAINDAFGHGTGDAVLRHIAQELKASTRTSDEVFRYGGEEFAILCPRMDHEQACSLADRVRHVIGASQGVTSAAGGVVTASVGVATAPGDGTDFPGLFTVADARLYAAKNSGRDSTIGRDPSASSEAGQPSVGVAI